MATDLGALSPNQLHLITGFAAATIRKRLMGLEPVGKKGVADLYDPPAALKRLYLPDTDGAVQVGVVNLSAEKARAEKQRADKLEMANAVTRGELLPRGDVLTMMQISHANVRAKLLAMPTKHAPALATLDNAAEVQAMLKAAVLEALEELTETDFTT